ncbi:ATP11 protein-domain-containing protein [Absidia repens]|uniref:ATP11 protein-domain-containing protein n=1 Tax=Absidia repens TaxID=90262 RepID=A0A1X2INY8_9FUNG|nr:ATP11 protein-domain-containing protein [Absidia repens]
MRNLKIVLFFVRQRFFFLFPLCIIAFPLTINVVNVRQRCVTTLPLYTAQSLKTSLRTPTAPLRSNLQDRLRTFATEAKGIGRSQKQRDASKTLKKATSTSAAAKPNTAEKVAATVTAKAQQPYDSSAPTLDKIVKLELFEKENAETIEKIWTQYHADKDCITAIIPSKVYDTLYKRSQAYPMFIVPMPRESGIEFFVMQFSFHQCHFTSLLEYKTKGTEARPFFTITHFPELASTKDIVLMRGEISDEPRMIDTQNAQFLAFTLQQFYATGDKTKFDMVETFHKAPQDFDYQALINEVEKVI